MTSRAKISAVAAFLVSMTVTVVVLCLVRQNVDVTAALVISPTAGIFGGFFGIATFLWLTRGHILT